MKNYLINIFILLLILLAYYLDIFELFVGKKALVFSFLLVIVMLLIGVKVLGNPFHKDKDDDE